MREPEEKIVQILGTPAIYSVYRNEGEDDVFLCVAMWGLQIDGTVCVLDADDNGEVGPATANLVGIIEKQDGENKDDAQERAKKLFPRPLTR